MISGIETFYQQDMLQLRGEGVLTLASLIDTLDTATARTKGAQPLRVLCDVRKMAIDKAVFGLFDSPRLLARAGLTRRDRFAVLCSTRDIQFFGMEDAALGNGYQMQAFTNKATAIAWLRSNAGMPEEWRPAASAGASPDFGVALDS